MFGGTGDGVGGAAVEVGEEGAGEEDEVGAGAGCGAAVAEARGGEDGGGGDGVEAEDGGNAGWAWEADDADACWGLPESNAGSWDHGKAPLPVFWVWNWWIEQWIRDIASSGFASCRWIRWCKTRCQFPFWIYIVQLIFYKLKAIQLHYMPFTIVSYQVGETVEHVWHASSKA